MATTLLLVHTDRAVVDALVSQFAAPALAGQFQVHGATTLEEALGAFEAQTIDVLVSDLVVAGTDGVQLAQFARSRFPSLQVIFTTQTASAEAEGRVRSVGGLGLIT
ncbi:MAG: response regulator, partial [Verrucomicrobia bacterium]|nr:response regulator [Verrucomicrobiota bacterium]